MEFVNHRFTLASRPVGMPKRSDWAYEEETVRDLHEGELLIRVLFISLDPAMRGWMNQSRSYVPPVGIGEVMRALALGQVVASRNPLFAVGKHVSGTFGVQEYFISEGKGLIEVDLRVAPLPTFLNVLGMTGMTAYFGPLDICRLQPGETVLVSGAAGAVGSLVGQVAKIVGSRAVGIAGSDQKVAWLVNELSFAGGFNHKTSTNYVARLKQLCPNGVDCYFDNVGGAITGAVFPVRNTKGRISFVGRSLSAML